MVYVKKLEVLLILWVSVLQSASFRTIPHEELWNYLQQGAFVEAVSYLGSRDVFLDDVMRFPAVHPIALYYVRKKCAERPDTVAALQAESLRRYNGAAEDTLSFRHEEILRNLLFLKYATIFCIKSDFACFKMKVSSWPKTWDTLLADFMQKMAYHTSYKSGMLCAATDIEESHKRMEAVVYWLDEVIKYQKMLNKPDWIFCVTNEVSHCSLFQYGQFKFTNSCVEHGHFNTLAKKSSLTVQLKELAEEHKVDLVILHHVSSPPRSLIDSPTSPLSMRQYSLGSGSSSDGSLSASPVSPSPMKQQSFDAFLELQKMDRGEPSVFFQPQRVDRPY